jgi:hypothetical protein
MAEHCDCQHGGEGLLSALTCHEPGLGGGGVSLSHLLKLQGTRVEKQKGAGEGEHSQDSVKRVIGVKCQALDHGQSR